MAPFEAFYASPVQHPWLLWAAAIAGLGWCLSRPALPDSLRRTGVALAGLSLVDAWLTSTEVYGLGRLGGAAASGVPLFFVLAGDFRYLWLLGAATAEGGVVPRLRPTAAALGLTLVVPALSQAFLSLLPETATGPRVLFLVYEVCFFGLVLVLWRLHPGLRRAAWLRGVTRVVLLYYGLWAGADLVLLATGSDLGFALRVLPNLLYYGGLIAAVGHLGAAAARGSGP